MRQLKIALFALWVFSLLSPATWAQNQSNQNQSDFSGVYKYGDSTGLMWGLPPPPPKIGQDWTVGVLPPTFGMNFNQSGINVQNYVKSLLGLPEIQSAFQGYTGTPIYNDFLLRAFNDPTGASVLANVTSLMNQQVTIRLLQDIMRRLILGPDARATMQAAAQQRCVELATVFGIMSVESAEAKCSGGPGLSSRGIMDFGAQSTTDTILSKSTIPDQDKQALKDLLLDYTKMPVANGQSTVSQQMPKKSAADFVQDIETQVCAEIHSNVEQTKAGQRVGGPLSVAGSIPVPAEVYVSLSGMEGAKKEMAIQGLCREQALAVARGKMIYLSQRFNQVLDGAEGDPSVTPDVANKYRAELRGLISDMDLMASQRGAEQRVMDTMSNIAADRTALGRQAARAQGEARRGRPEESNGFGNVMGPGQ